MKITHILSKSLCMYGGQVAARSTGGWGVAFLAWAFLDFVGMNRPGSPSRLNIMYRSVVRSGQQLSKLLLYILLNLRGVASRPFGGDFGKHGDRLTE